MKLGKGADESIKEAKLLEFLTEVGKGGYLVFCLHCNARKGFCNKNKSNSHHPEITVLELLKHLSLKSVIYDSVFGGCVNLKKCQPLSVPAPASLCGQTGAQSS